MTQKARPFPANQEYSTTVRQYLNRLSTMEAASDTQFAAITSRLGQLEQDLDGLIEDVGGLEQDVTVLQGDVSGALVAIAQLQQTAADQAGAIDLLNFRYDSVRVDLDGVLAAMPILAGELDQVEATVAAQTLTVAALDARVTLAEGDIDAVQLDIQALQHADVSLASQIQDNQARLDTVIESQGQPFSGYRLPVSDAVLGTVPKVVGVLILPAGEQAAPSAYLGCPTTPVSYTHLTLPTTPYV